MNREPVAATDDAAAPTRNLPNRDFATLAKQFIPFQNRTLEEAEPILRTQFSYTGSSVENGIGLIEESRSNFKYFCTGRRFLTRFVADLELLNRHDLMSRIFRIIVPSSDYLTIDVGLHSKDVDPFIFSISKKLGFNALSKIFPELIETAKQVSVKEVPESMWVSTDSTEIPKVALTQSLQAAIRDLEYFLEYIVITDMNKQMIVGMPKTQKHILRVRFKLYAGSKKLDVPKALQLVLSLIDGSGATIKLSPNDIARRQADIKERKHKQYTSLSYEEQQKIDAQNEKKATRKRFNRKTCNSYSHEKNVDECFKMELSYPLIRVPFEETSKTFRLYHKQLTRELAQATAQIEALGDEEGQQPGHRMDVNVAIAKLAELARTLRNLKQSAKSYVVEQQSGLESCAKRARYLETLEDAKIGGDQSGKENNQDKAINDRLIADYLLSQGYLASAKIIEDTKDIGHLVDHDLHTECQLVLKDLRNHRTATAITWCSQNGTRLRRLQSQLEFHVRRQDFIELVRSHKPLEAVKYARAYLTPLAMQPEKQTLRDAAIGEVQIAMATLAFEAPATCGIVAYEKVFSMDRWLMLEKLFYKTFNEVYGIHDPPSLCIAVHAGLSTLNTRTCHLTRDANLKARLAWLTEGFKQRQEGEEIGDNEDSSNESDEIWFKLSTAHEKKAKRDAATSELTNNSSGSKKRKHTGAELPVPICPACSEVGSQLCTGLPFAYHPHSRLVCRVTQSVMDEHNPPLVLPNGRVYSKRGIELLTQRSADGMIKCVDTEDVFSPTDVKPVYIL
ncbi:hypothetical protein G195_003432 [Phytophthora kernoviae 00238/432]|uniref:Macrophage erythroblast attacher n=1 Tax=Phytophthora kernoviae 00238/432 TaxID=1284355 RepID=A0A8J4W9W8_9STRA|nr:hypothetical protein G195_003432 [Phytophthora kernoviae 00238/432]